MIKTVIKIGGSMGESPQLALLANRLSEIGSEHGVLIVPGGGAFADTVREYDRRFDLAQDVCHWMAILAMDQYGYLLSSLISNGKPVLGLADAREVLAAGRMPVLLTHTLLFQTDPLPRSWDVTSDSIAAWVAGLAGVRQLILVKSVEGLFEHGPDASGKPRHLKEVDLNDLIRCQGVDPYFARMVMKYKLSVWVVNGKHPERLAQLLDTGRTEGTHFMPPDP